MNFDVIIQCRFYSTRLPGKILIPLNKKLTSLDILIKNLKRIKEINRIILTVPNDDAYKVFNKISKIYDIKCYAPKCKHENVLKRFYDCAKKNNIDNILRITGDCPLIDPKLIDKIINVYQKKKVDYLSNVENRTFPDGMDIELFSFEALSLANSLVYF